MYRAFLISGLILAAWAQAAAQSFDPAWFRPGQPYVKVGVVEDGVYRLTGSDLAGAGVSLATVNPDQIQVFERGAEIPVWVETASQGTFGAQDHVEFVGRRNRGKEEIWAYHYNENWQSSDYYSLYTDTTYYWVTWNREPGMRYENVDPEAFSAGASEVNATREFVHHELDNIYYHGDADQVGNPLYTRGEGWYMSRFSHAVGSTTPVAQTYTLSLPHAVPSSDAANISVRVTGETVTRHHLVVEAEILQNGAPTFREIGEADWTGYAFRTLEGSFAQTEIPANGNVRIRVTSRNDFGASPNRSLLDYVRIEYLRATNLMNGRLGFHLEGAGRQQVHLGGASNPTVVYAPDAGRRFDVPPSGGAAVFADELAGSRRAYWGADEGSALQPASVSPAQPADLAASSHAVDYLIITTPALRASAEALANHHRSTKGYDVLIVHVRDVFDIFDYGRPTPIAIKRFLHHTQSWSTTPRYLMMWGDATYPARKIAISEWEVPSFGNASSDGWFAMHTNGADDWTEFLAIGRVTVRNNEEGALFLEKLKRYEAAPPAAWQKRALMLAGGNTIAEQTSLQSHSNRWSNVVAGAPYGGDIRKFYKQATTSIDPTFQDSLRAAIREGAGWLNYFGHSAAFTWEIVTDPPAQFNNADRLPVAVSLGCLTGAFAGDRHATVQQRVLAEQLVIGSLNGAIAHWGGSSNSFIGPSARLADPMFELAFRDTVRSLGKIFQYAKRRYVTSGAVTSSTIFHSLQYNLIGDPATRLTLPHLPDFYVGDESISIHPIAPVPADSNLTVNVSIRNFGLVPTDSVTVQLTHFDPRSIRQEFRKRIPAFNLRYDAKFEVPINEESIGDNRFQVDLDPDGEYAEMNEANNRVSRTHVVFASGLSVAFPANFGIVNTTQPLIRTLLSSPGAPGTPVLFEIDTSPDFGSPGVRRRTVHSAGLTADLQIADPLEDGTTYYWRARVDDGSNLVNWFSASFTVRTDLDRTGFLQTGRQFESASRSPTLGWSNGTWAFSEYNHEIQVISSWFGAGTRGFIVNGTTYERLGLGFGLLVLDGQSGAIRGVGSATLYENNQNISVEAARALFDELIGKVREGDYLMVVTRHLGRTGSAEIPEDIKDVFRSFGSSAIDTLDYTDLWVMQARKGFPDETIEVAQHSSETNELWYDVSLPFNFPSGGVTSPPIGPAQRWDRALVSIEAQHESQGARLKVLSAETGAVLRSSEPGESELDLSDIDADEHPRLRLSAELFDDTQAGTPQLAFWAVTFDPVAHLILQPGSLALSAEQLQEGQFLEVETTLSNVGRSLSGEMVAEFSVTDARNETHVFARDTVGVIPVDSSVTVRADLDTHGFVGSNLLRVRIFEVGREHVHTQHSVQVSEFAVHSDGEPPTLRVLIDGIEYPSDPNPVTNLTDPSLPFVPMQPMIEVLLADENPFLPLSDTTLVEVRLSGRRVWFDSSDLHFEPATSERNEARVTFTPDLTQRDTTHTLVVSAEDASGNRAVNSPYQVHFRVQHDVTVDNVYPYPNPMSTFTNFAFLLRGNDVSTVEDFRIRIYTVAGRLVREMDLVRDPFHVEGGGLRVGWNKVRWDGRDEDGDPVATGVYLYRSFIRVNGENVSLGSTNNVERIAVIR